MLGALLIGVFANTAFNEAGADGLLAGGGLTLLGKQAVAVVATLAFSFILSFALLKAVDLVVGLRVTEEDELAGLDITQHEEVGYAFSEGVGVSGPGPDRRGVARARLLNRPHAPRRSGLMKLVVAAHRRSSWKR